MTPLRESGVLKSPTPLRKNSQGIHNFSSGKQEDERKSADENLNDISDDEDEANLDDIDES